LYVEDLRVLLKPSRFEHAHRARRRDDRQRVDEDRPAAFDRKRWNRVEVEVAHTVKARADRVRPFDVEAESSGPLLHTK
jgi:hypothetical protein